VEDLGEDSVDGAPWVAPVLFLVGSFKFSVKGYQRSDISDQEARARKG
jgi:hypothetical protein